MAHVLAYAIPDDDDAGLGGAEGSALSLPIVPLASSAPPRFVAAVPVETPEGVSTTGDYAWPGSWKLERDEVTGRSTMNWTGKSAIKFPWGTYEHTEKLRYEVDDSHPEAAAAEGEAESIELLADRTLIYRGRLTLSGDAKTFHYGYTRELLRDGKVIRTRSWHEDVPRDFQ